MAKKKKRKDGLNFSTGSDTKDDNPFAALSGLGNLPIAPPNRTENLGADAGAEMGERAKMQLRVTIDRKYRRGKEVTLISGWEATDEELQRIAKLLKQKCGIGGSAKDNEIVIQGNKRDRVMVILAEEGYSGAKKSGGS